jgi:hypothetical protein
MPVASKGSWVKRARNGPSEPGRLPENDGGVQGDIAIDSVTGKCTTPI